MKNIFSTKKYKKIMISNTENNEKIKFFLLKMKTIKIIKI